MVVGGVFFSILLSVVADARLPSSFCGTAAIKLNRGKESSAPELLIVHDDASILQGLESELDRKLARQSFQDFVSRLVLRTKDSTAEISIRKRIEETLLKLAEANLRTKVVAAAEQIKAIHDIKDASKRRNEMTSLQRRIAREVMDELPVDQVVWREVAPFLKDFYSTLDAKKRILFDDVIPALEMRIRNRLLRAGIPESEVHALTSRYLKQSIPLIAESLAVEVVRSVNRNDNEAVRTQRNRIVQGVVRRLGLMDVEWRTIAPEFVSIEPTLSPVAKNIFHQVAPGLVESLMAQAWRRVNLESKEAMEPVFHEMLAYSSQALGAFIEVDINTNGVAQTKAERETQVERIHHAVLGLISYERTVGIQKADALFTSIPSRHRVAFFSGFSELVRLSKAKISWTMGEGDFIPAEQVAYLEMLIPAYRLKIDTYFKGSPKRYEGTSVFDLMASEASTENPYIPADVPLSGALLEISKSLGEREVALLKKHSKRISHFVETRASLLPRKNDRQQAARDLYQVLGKILPEVLNHEINEQENLAQDWWLQSGRIVERLRRTIPLQPSEIVGLPLALNEYRTSLSDKQRRFFDFAYPHLAARHLRYSAETGTFEKVFLKMLPEMMLKDEDISDYLANPDSFRWQARVWAMNVYQARFKNSPAEDVEVARAVDSILRSMKADLKAGVETQAAKLSAQGSTGRLVVPTTDVTPKLPKPVKKQGLVDDSEVASDWDAFKNTGSDEARSKLWEHYQPLVRYHAEIMKSRLPESVEFGDLEGAGQVGLEEALVKYDLSKGVKFTTFSAQRIRGSMLDWLRTTMPWSRQLQDISDIRKDAIDEFTVINGRPPSDEELRDAMTQVRDARGLSFDVEEAMLRPTLNAQSFDAPVGHEDSTTRGDLVADPEMATPLENHTKADFYEVILQGFTRAEKLILVLYYREGQTMKEIGPILGLSESRVSQMHTAIIQQLRARFAGREEIFGLFSKQRKSDAPTEDED